MEILIFCGRLIEFESLLFQDFLRDRRNDSVSICWMGGKMVVVSRVLVIFLRCLDDFGERHRGIIKSFLEKLAYSFFLFIELIEKPNDYNSLHFGWS
ncbi:hypothetical protein [Pelagicoccus mobilis]|uniref:Uncharacterized protein n=1 Tax=Pelagicoccus mobilis TaxID=415221 RepID=A0A934VQU0_9BACT|nr:hypothetical protein [Pelagicoccus mobilis]MBK1877250.1 hypothetical protein [Pelagicoccus mobilis]